MWILTGNPKKLEPKRKGPVLITQVHEGNTYSVQNQKGEVKQYHLNRLHKSKVQQDAHRKALISKKLTLHPTKFPTKLSSESEEPETEATVEAHTLQPN